MSSRPEAPPPRPAPGAPGRGRFRRLLDRPVVVDVALAALALAVSLAGLPPTPPAADSESFGPLDPLGVVVLVVASASLVVRRRHPVAVWVTCTALVLVLVPALGAAGHGLPVVALALYSVAAYTSRGVAVVTALLTALVGFVLVTREFGVGATDPLTYAAIAWTFLAAALGDAVRSNRQVVASAVDRAERAEASREEEARRRVAEERLHIGRELHDVVAHHVATITVHAGVAEHLLADDPRAAARALRQVRESSGRALVEMHALVDVLRDPSGSDAELEPLSPAPGLADVDDLVTAARDSGSEVRWARSGTFPAVPDTTGLHLYRILQEALTNAARHGRGPVELTTSGAPDGIHLRVCNARAGQGRSGSGHGLVGMTERAALVGAELEAGPDPTGGSWVVDLRLPVRGGEGG